MSFIDDGSLHAVGDEITVEGTLGWTKSVDGAYLVLWSSSSDFAQRSDGAGSGNSFYSCTDQGSANHETIVRATSTSSTINGVVRAVDQSNWFGVQAGGTGSAGVRLAKCVSGTITNTVTFQWYSGLWVKAVADGSDVGIYAGGTGSTPGTWTQQGTNQTDSNTTETSQGFVAIAHVLNGGFQYFEAGALGGGPTLITSTDTLAPSLTESQASFLESSLSDVLTPSVSDAVQLLKNPEFVAVSDALSISVAEAVSLLGSAIVSDALTPSIGDLASLDTGGAINVNVTDALTPTLSESQQSTLYAAVLDALSLSLGEEQGSLLFSGVTDVVPLSVSESVSLLVAHTATDTLVVSITDLSSVATFNTIAKAVSDALAPYFDLVGGYEVRSLWADKAAAVSVWVAATPDAATWTDATPKTDTWSDVE